jgi:hypothetical protein
VCSDNRDLWHPSPPVFKVVHLVNFNSNEDPNPSSDCLRHDTSHSHKWVGFPNAPRLTLRPTENRNQEEKSKNEVFNNSEVVKPSWEKNIIPKTIPALLLTPKQTKVNPNVPTVGNRLRKNFSHKPNVELVVVNVRIVLYEQIGEVRSYEHKEDERTVILIRYFFEHCPLHALSETEPVNGERNRCIYLVRNITLFRTVSPSRKMYSCS